MMYLKRKDAKRLLVEFQQSSIEELKEKSTFIYKLLEQDDWSFTIKAHAYLESAVTQMIIDHIGETHLKPFIERLPLSDSMVGKLAIVKQLALLKPKERAFVRWFSEFRNLIVHRIENINFDMKAYFAELDKNKRKSTYEIISWNTKTNEEKSQSFELLNLAPKVSISMSLVSVISSCVLSSKQSVGQRETQLLAEKTMTELFKE